MKKNNNEVTIVTAYFDIGRSSFAGYERGNNKYINFFKFWARIKNNVVIYTQKIFKDEIEQIRADFGLKDRTKIIVVDDIYKLEPVIYKRMCELEKNNVYQEFRYQKNNIDSTAKYDYLMFLKNWCLKDAKDKGYIKTNFAAWLDFGFNHGGTTFIDPKDFDFLWEYPFDEKIYIYGINKDEGLPIFKIVQSGEVYVSGAPYIVPVSLMDEFYSLILESLNSLLDVGLLDDDQTYLLMSYRKRKDLFHYDVLGWNMLIHKYGGKCLKIKDLSKDKMKFKDKLLYKYRVRKRNKRYLKSVKKIFLKDYLD